MRELNHQRQEEGPFRELSPWFEWLDAVLSNAMTAALKVYGEGAAADPYRGLYISHRDFENLLARGPSVPGFVLGGAAEAPSAASSRLRNLAENFSLSSFETGALFIAFAPEADLRYERLFAYLQDDVTRRRPTVDLVLNLLCSSAEEKLVRRSDFLTDAPLIRHRLIRLQDGGQPEPTFLSRAVQLEHSVTRYLFRQEGLDPKLESYGHLVDPGRSLDEVMKTQVVSGSIEALVEEAVEHRQRLRFYFEGPNRGAKFRLAEAVAGCAGQKLISFDLEAAAAGSPDFEETLRSVFRDARLLGGALFLFNLNGMLSEERRDHLRALLARIGHDSSPRLLMISGKLAWTSLPEVNGAPVLEVYPVAVDLPDFDRRRDYWAERLEINQVGAQAVDLEALAGRFRFSEDQIDRTILAALFKARLRNGGDRDSIPTLDELYAMARRQSNHNLGSLARKITPRYRWSDIVLPQDVSQQLREICNQAKHRQLVYGEWGFDAKLSLGKGLNVLFSGPPGTGKTMAAEILAGELKLDLYRIDLSQIVSKYIGETERNLDRVFAEARQSNAILFFDEADALFGKRSEVRDAHDRYANIEISYLLQKMEEYDGISVLATNLKKNLDEAFTRRLSFTVEFPFPDASSRRRIWAGIWPQALPLAEDLDLDFIASQFQLTGGSIKNIAVAAAFLAAEENSPVKTEHILLATRREFQKMGKTLSRSEFGDYLDRIQLPAAEGRAARSGGGIHGGRRVS